MKINVHAGHNPDGKIACGAVGLIKESTQARKVKNELKKILKARGHKVYDCTVNDGLSQSDVLKKIVNKCNKHKVDVDLSIHFNCAANDYKGNGVTTGVETYVYSNLDCVNGKRARAICERISELGYKNRGAKIRSNLYVLHHTASPAILVECCFVDDKDDADIYDAKKMARAIADGIELK